MTRTLTRRLAITALTLGLTVATIGCDRDTSSGAAGASSPQADAAAKARGNVLSFINRGKINTLDLNEMSYLQDFRVSYALREGLYRPNSKTLVPEPCLAQETKLSDDKKTWTFTLRDDGKWSNGDRVTAQDFVFSWRYLLQLPGQYTYLLYYIHGAKEYADAYRAGDAPSFDKVGIKAPDDHTIILTLDNPVPYLLDLLTFPTF